MFALIQLTRLLGIKYQIANSILNLPKEIDVFTIIIVSTQPERNICVIIFVTPLPLLLHDLVKRLQLAFKHRRLKITIIIIIIILKFSLI